MLNEELFENRLARAREASQDPATLAIIANTLRDWNARGEFLALNRINPWRVANENGLSLERVAPEFIRGVKSQLFSLHWEVHCPHCNGVANEYADLADAHEHSSCGMCAVDFPADFNERVEVSFSLAKDILAFDFPPIGAVNPALEPTDLLKGALGAGESKTVELVIKPGEYRLVCPYTRGHALLIVSGAATDEVQEATIIQRGGEFDATRIAVRPGPVRFHVANQAPSLTGLWMTHHRLAPVIGPAAAPRLTGLQTIHLPAFQELFGKTSLSERERLNVESVTLMFTDIKGSTELYSRLGDARAYNIVRDHFDLLTAAVSEAGGRVMKTIGDAIMASFLSNYDAVHALALIRDKLAAYNDAQDAQEQVRIRVGLHRGPAILVNLNDRLDYFGTTVNTAARVEGAASADEATITEELVEDPAGRRALQKFGFVRLKRRKLQLRGLQAETTLYGVSLRATPAAVA